MQELLHVRLWISQSTICYFSRRTVTRRWPGGRPPLSEFWLPCQFKAT